MAHPGPGSRAHKREGGGSKVVYASGAACYYIQGKTRVSYGARQLDNGGMSQVFGRRWWSVYNMAVLGLVAVGTAAATRRGPIVDDPSATLISATCDERKPLRKRPDHQPESQRHASQPATSEFHARAQGGEDCHLALLHSCCVSHPSAVSDCHVLLPSLAIALAATESVLSLLTRTVLPLQKVKLCISSRHHRGTL